MTSRVEVGFYGKLPSHGDFLHRRVPDAFVEKWDPWLQDALSSSREVLDDRWLDTYLTSPAWRFAAAPGAIGSSAVAGIMAPSVDRVGRYFYVTVVATLPEVVWPGDVATRASSFFEQAEELAIEAVSAEALDLEAFDRQVANLFELLGGLAVPPPIVLDASASELLETGRGDQWHFPLGSPPRLADALQQVLWQRMAATYGTPVLWWTDGSSAVEPSGLVTSGLPHAEDFAAMLDGNWTTRRWRSVAGRLNASAVASDTLLDDLTPPKFRSIGATDVGRVRSVNQDAFLERPELGLWAVADGMGGHSDGELASRMVCDALADFSPAGSFEQMIGDAGQRVQDVNAYLARLAEADEPSRSGSTVVAFLARGSRCAVLWAGDSRAYRCRGGSLEQLTRDHSVELDGHESTAITRAVGGDSTLTLDILRDRVQPGDRFLLCSDGLTRYVPDVQISKWLQEGTIGGAVDGLIRATLDAGAPDNVTALVVEAY
jgi:type VI secretion system protein ImpM